jgi:hypothetical protein
LGFAVLSPTYGLRGRLAGSPFNLACARFVEPEVLILPPKNKNPPDGGFLFFWLGDQDYSPLRGSPLRGRLAGSPFNLACARFVEPEVLILVPQKQKPA